MLLQLLLHLLVNFSEAEGKIRLESISDIYSRHFRKNYRKIYHTLQRYLRILSFYYLSLLLTIRYFQGL